MLLRRAAVIATAILIVAVMGPAAQSATARVVQTIGTTGAHPLRFPHLVAVDPAGNVYVTDSGDRDADPSWITVYSPAGIELRRWRLATASGSDAAMMVVDPAGNVYVAAESSHAVLKYSPTGGLLGRWATSPPSSVDAGPTSLGIDPAGNVVVLDVETERIETFAPDGRLVLSRPYPPRTVGVGPSGAVYVAERRAIVKQDAAGNVVARIPRPAQLPAFGALAEGPAGTLYAPAADRIVKIGPDGAYLGSVGVASFEAAVGSDGSIYVPQFSVFPRGRGFVLRLAPITVVDVTRPSVTVDRFAPARAGSGAGRRARLPLGRLHLTISEDAALRITLWRRVPSGRFAQSGRFDVPAATAGANALALDRRRFGPGQARVLRPGRYRLKVIARDDSGNESPPAQVTFRVRR